MYCTVYAKVITKGRHAMLNQFHADRMPVTSKESQS
jgi:hypothetical protein